MFLPQKLNLSSSFLFNPLKGECLHLGWPTRAYPSQPQVPAGVRLANYASLKVFFITKSQNPHLRQGKKQDGCR